MPSVAACSASPVLRSLLILLFAAELLSTWLERWASFLIVFLFMLLLAALLALFGWKKVKTVGAPQKTINSVNELKNLVPGQATQKLEARNRGMYS